jgi:hypothetical protein
VGLGQIAKLPAVKNLLILPPTRSRRRAARVILQLSSLNNKRLILSGLAYELFLQPHSDLKKL